jgi:hypothetical protein
MTLSLQPIQIADDVSGESGLLVFNDGLLVAVFVSLNAPHYGGEQGHWHLEIGFGRCSSRPASYPTLQNGLAWVAGRLGMDAKAGVACAMDYLAHQ